MPTRVLMGNCALETAADLKFFVGKSVVFEDVMRREEEEKASVENSCIKNVCCSDDSSSIGKNSDVSENSLEKSVDSEEVQSPYKGPLDAMEALEEVLPIRRGISRFYNGKSKSFATLSDVSSSSSMKELVKPENAYTRRRRNILASSITWDKTREKGFSTLRGTGGGISKKLTLTGSGSRRTTLALAVAMRNSKSDKQQGERNASTGAPSMSSSRKEFSSLRSYSLADLQHCISMN